MKNIKTLSIVLCGFVSLLFSQTSLTTAVDFTAKDTDGKSHNLFTYLNAGKHVLIKFTSTT